jgi:pimeloyl-ACP methyl ester carboxylesterase
MGNSPITPRDAAHSHNFTAGADGVRLHYVRRGGGVPVLLLHGWPGFWYDWRRIISNLADAADVIAPDLRGFGLSPTPEGPAIQTSAPDSHARDLIALLDALKIERALVVGHDIGAVVAQELALTVPRRVARLVLFNPPYAGIGQRRYAPEASAEFWYYNFHDLPLAPALVVHSRETLRLYLAHFYDHWVGRKASVRADEFQAIVDSFARPGVFESSISYYRARAAQRRAASAATQTLPIKQPTRILWGALDPVIKVAWADRLVEFFPHMSLTILRDVGHFVPFEAPDEALVAIKAELELFHIQSHAKSSLVEVDPKGRQ